MDDFPGLLARDFGFRPQGKSAPMTASKGTGNIGSGGTLNYGIGSGGDTRSSSLSSNLGKSGWNSNPIGGSFLDDHDGLFGSTGNQKTKDYGDLGGYADVFGGPPKYTNPSDGAPSASSFDYDSIFQGSKNSGAKSSSLPVFDKPVYDDDIFDGVPGMKNSSSVKYDDVFSSISSPPKQNAPYDDLLGNLGRTEPESKSSSGKTSREVEKNVSGFDDLLAGFGASSLPNNRATSETSRTQQSSVHSTKSTSGVIEDPFVVLESTSTPAYASSGLFTEPLEQVDKQNKSGSTKVDVSSVRGAFDDMDPLVGFAKSAPLFASDMNNRGRDKSPLTKGPTMTNVHNSAGKEPTERPSMKAAENASQKKMDVSPQSEDNLEAADDVWLTVSEISLFTQLTSAPPPSRPPPPRPVYGSKAVKGSFSAVSSKKVNEFSSFQPSGQNFQSPKTVPDSVKSSGVSSIDELEDFAMGRPRYNADEHGDVLSSAEEVETNSAAAASAAAMKEAMDRAEAKFKQAREVRERENAKAARSRGVGQQEQDEKAMQDAQERELREKQERLDREREQREKEEKERERKQLEREREQAQEIEREKARQAVERATKEARERAATEARLKAERAAVEKAQAEARERAERAAVQRAQAEARERAAAEARDRVERAVAEARERAQAEAREKAAAVARAEAEARRRAERAAVERAAAEARERAAAEARERAAAAARGNQQKNENDLEAFFNMGARPSSVPRSRTTSDSAFDAQFNNRTAPEGTQRSSTGTSSSMRKASSTTNIVDDLTSIFGAPPSSGEFQEVEGESEDRRRARLVRHQRTQERAAKALADKNERDLQTQREQAERHRISETLDAEIKRWAAGKEGNLRALLSTLQYVLWPECGWQPVSLTDLITTASVKKVYRKATLCIHPDKVQQKGANLQQKYIAEKVFDLLKEAWNKLNSEELF